MFQCNSILQKLSNGFGFVPVQNLESFQEEDSHHMASAKGTVSLFPCCATGKGGALFADPESSIRTEEATGKKPWQHAPTAESASSIGGILAQVQTFLQFLLSLTI